MGRDAEDDDHTSFLRLEGKINAAGDEVVLSRAAVQLHSFGIVNSIRDGHAGFVSDDYLNAIAAETTVTAAELCTAGLWSRAEGGYDVLDRDLLDVAVQADRQAAQQAAVCAVQGHRPDPEYPKTCEVCGNTL